MDNVTIARIAVVVLGLFIAFAVFMMIWSYFVGKKCPNCGRRKVFSKEIYLQKEKRANDPFEQEPSVIRGVKRDLEWRKKFYCKNCGFSRILKI